MNVYMKIKHAQLRLKRDKIITKYKVVAGKSLICALLWIMLIQGVNQKLSEVRSISIINPVLASTQIEERANTTVVSEDISKALAKVEEVKVASSVPDIEQMILAEFGEDAETAILVSMAESRMNPQAIGDTHLSKPSYGLFQISRIYHDYSVETLLDPAENIKIAHKIASSGRGWNNWTTFRNGQYLNYR